MRIKQAEGQTLLTFIRLGIVFIACLSVGNMQHVADTAFAFFRDFSGVTNEILNEDSFEPPGEPVVLFYSEHVDGGIRHIYQQYYLTGHDGAYGLIDAINQRVLDEKYEDIIIVPYTYILKINGQWGFYDRTTMESLSDERWDNVAVEYTENGSISSKLITVERDGLKGAVNLRGKLVIEPLYNEFRLYAQQVDWPLVLVKRDGYYGFLDDTGEVVISLRYDYAVMDTVLQYADENDAEGTEVPIIYVLRDGDWGAITRESDGNPSPVDWSIDPTDEVSASYEHQQAEGQ